MNQGHRFLFLAGISFVFMCAGKAQVVTQIGVRESSHHSVILKDDGSLWATGSNYNGQLGDGTNNNTNRLERIIASGIAAIAGGGSHTLFLMNDGSFWGVGGDNYGELGDGNFITSPPYGINQPEEILPSGVIAIAAGAHHTLFVKNDGSLWAVGDN